MASKNRDEFSEHVRRSLCERVNGLCSRPDCRVVTRGAQADTEQSFTIGRACHIHAAAEGGPRYLKTQTREERRGFANGIWLCANHGGEVDADQLAFPADMLRTWKEATEAHVRSMVGQMPSYVPEPPRTAEGLIAIGPHVLVFGRVAGHEGKAWQLSLGDFLLGDLHDLYRFVDGFDSAAQEDRYACLERAGTAGLLVRAPSISDDDTTTVGLEFAPALEHHEALAKYDARSIGRDMAIDIERPEPRLVRGREVAGLDAVPQRLFSRLAGVKGGWHVGDENGTRIAEWNARFAGDHIESIIAIEIARLAVVPHYDDILVRLGRAEVRPSLGFVKRVRGVRMMDPRSPKYLLARLSLDIWGLPNTGEFDVPIPSSIESLGPKPTLPSLRI